MILQALRSGQFAAVLLRSWLDRTEKTPARWLQKTAARCATVLGLEVTCVGELPRAGLIAANHLGYLDIVALASVLPCRFVAKSDVAAWPVFGAFAKRGGSIFINRQRRSDVARTNDLLAHALADPLCTVIFPEGTSSSGKSVLPLHSSLLEPAIVSRTPITPLGISYSPTEAEMMAYHGDMTLLPHLWKLFGIRKMRIVLAFGEPRILDQPRKIAAGELRKEIALLAARGHLAAAEVSELPSLFYPADQISPSSGTPSSYSPSPPSLSRLPSHPHGSATCRASGRRCEIPPC